ncbi:MAG: hypothetical protein KDB82_07815 [Planctomycetes bacterium]|nr:hypothetical protein [Planctomycetota bacterium]
MHRSIAVSNRFVAEGIAGQAATQRAARALAEGAIELGVPVAFTNNVTESLQSLEVIAPAGTQLADIPGFRPLGRAGWIQYIPNSVAIRVHEAGTPILGGPVEWPDPRQTDRFMGIPVLRLNAFLETEITRALNSGNRDHEDNAIAAILSAGATLDRALELHPYVADRYQDLWEQARAGQLWPAVA